MNFDVRAKYYNYYRKADIRLTKKVIELLDMEPNSTLLDVGAGTGNYSISMLNMGYNVIALEPEKKMIEQCSDNRIKWINSSVDHIPLPNNSIDGAIIVNAIHHFKDIKGAFQELKRVAGKGPIVIITFDPNIACKQWVFDYWPELVKYEYSHYLDFDVLKQCIIAATGGKLEEYIYKLPYDFEDTFAASLWKRPHLLLEHDDLRYSMSIFSSMDDKSFNDGLNKLKRDIISHNWENKYYYLLDKTEWDVGCRLLKLTIF